MNTSQKNLKESLKLYLNDIEDYGEPEELKLAEIALRPFKTILTEGKKPTKDLIKEILNQAEPKYKVVISDFLSYYNNI